MARSNQMSLKGEVRSKTKILYVVENGVELQDLKYYSSYFRTFPDIPNCFSSKLAWCKASIRNFSQQGSSGRSDIIGNKNKSLLVQNHEVFFSTYA